MFEAAKVRKEVERKRIEQKADEILANEKAQAEAKKERQKAERVADIKKRVEEKRISDLRAERYKNATKEERKKIPFSEKPKLYQYSVIGGLVVFTSVLVNIFGDKFPKFEPTQADIARFEAEREIEAKEKLAATEANAKEEAEQNAKTARLYAISAGQTALEGSLRDPDSVKYDVKAYNLTNNALCYAYRAKNGFGGYSNGYLVIVNSAPKEGAKNYKKYCNDSFEYEVY